MGLIELAQHRTSQKKNMKISTDRTADAPKIARWSGPMVFAIFLRHLVATDPKMVPVPSGIFSSGFMV